MLITRQIFSFEKIDRESKRKVTEWRSELLEAVIKREKDIFARYWFLIIGKHGRNTKG